MQVFVMQMVFAIQLLEEGQVGVIVLVFIILS